MFAAFSGVTLTICTAIITAVKLLSCSFYHVQLSVVQESTNLIVIFSPYGVLNLHKYLTQNEK